MAEPRALAELIDAIKNSLGLDEGLSVTAALRQANTTLGLASQGTLPFQVHVCGVGGAPPRAPAFYPARRCAQRGRRRARGRAPCVVAPAHPTP